MSRKKVVEDTKEEVKKPTRAKKETAKKTSKSTKEEIVKEEKITKPTKKKTTIKTEKIESVLSKKEQKTLKTLCKIVAVITKILKVCAMIIVPIIAIVSIIIPIIFSKIEVNGNIVKFNDIRFVMNNDYITANIGDKTYVISDHIENMDKIIDYINSNSIQRMMISLELTLIFSIIVVIINIYLLGYVERLFNNFYHEKTPFTGENSNYIKHIGKIMIISLIASIIFEFALSFFIDDISKVHFGSHNIIGIIIVYITYYIFLYAAKLQEKEKTCIYD